MNRVARGGARVLAAGIAVIGVGGCGSGTGARNAVPIPNVVGTSAVAATARLEHAGLHVVSSLAWNGERVGRVVAEHPADGIAKRGQTVAIVVAARSRLIPDLVGLPAGAAAAKLRRHGFSFPGGAPADGVVTAQQPAPGWSRPDASVHLRFATGAAGLLREVERSFADSAMPGGQLSTVRCATAPQAGAYKCSGYAAAIDYRIAEVVAFRHGRVMPWQPPPAPASAKPHRHGHGRHGHHSHGTGPGRHGAAHGGHGHGGHGHRGHAGTPPAATTATTATTTTAPGH